MSRNGHWQSGRAGALRAFKLLCLLASQRKALSFFAALVLLFNAAVPYWHAAQKAQAWASAYRVPQAKHESLPSAELECHHRDGAAPAQTGNDQAPPDKQSCPLCKALQHLSPSIAPPVFVFIPCAPPAFAALVPSKVELKAARNIAEQGRPRAPPLA
jgi:hypothetical protein